MERATNNDESDNDQEGIREPSSPFGSFRWQTP
jgi:hypothetical protein